MESVDGEIGRRGVGEPGADGFAGAAPAHGSLPAVPAGIRSSDGVPDAARDTAPAVALPSGLPVQATEWLADVHARAASPASGLSSAGWVELVGQCQAVVNSLTAAQDAALARLACLEVDVAEDGTLVERAHPLGHQALDAPDLAAPALGVSHPHAARRMSLAVRCAGDGPAGSSSSTGLAGLHEAMREGRLDGYRAGVVADELDQAPAQVAAAVVEALQRYFATETGADLRRRVRRALARISPDLLVERARRARARSGLRRWVDEPGLDRWDGTFPSEEAAGAWAAIDALAQRYVADGVCQGIDRARAKALTDLVTGNATVEVVLSLTAPVDVTAGEPEAASASAACGGQPVAPEAAGESEAGAAAGEPGTGAPGGLEPLSDDDLVEVQGPRPFEPVLVPRGWLLGLTRATAAAARRPSATPLVCDPVTGALIDPGDALATPVYRPSARLAAFVRARDGRCRFPGCTVVARFCDLDHVRPWPVGPTSARNLMCLCRRHHRVKQRPGWMVRLLPDAVVSWTDPTGRVRTTRALDRLTPIVLPATPTDLPGAAPAPSRPDDDGQPQGLLDVVLEHALAFAQHDRGPSSGAVRLDLTRCRFPASLDTDMRCRTHARRRRGRKPRGRDPGDDPPF